HAIQGGPRSRPGRVVVPVRERGREVEADVRDDRGRGGGLLHSDVGLGRGIPLAAAAGGPSDRDHEEGRRMSARTSIQRCSIRVPSAACTSWRGCSRFARWGGGGGGPG